MSDVAKNNDDRLDKFNIDDVELINPINWNKVEDDVDKTVWDKLVNNFWVPEKVSLYSDLASWETLTPEEKNATNKVFAGLTLLDTLQGKLGAVSLIPDAITQIEESVYANIAFMEAFSGDTELLTPNGWKKIKNITDNDKVIQYSPKKNTMSFVSPKIVPSHFADEVYEIISHDGQSKQVVSGGHRVYYEDKNPSSKERWNVSEARDLYKNWNSIRHNISFRQTGFALDGKGLSIEERLMIMLQTDNIMVSNKNFENNFNDNGKETVPYYIPNIFNEEQRKKLVELSFLAGWNMLIHPNNSFVLMVPSEYAKSKNKVFSEWFNLENVSHRWAKEFLDEVSFWDKNTTSREFNITIFYAEEENADFLVAIASLAGYSSRIIKNDFSYRTFGLCSVEVDPAERTIDGSSMSMKKVDGQEVYCVQVPSTFLLTRNGETPVISGNCIHAKSYSSIFSTLLSTTEINEVFRWSKENEFLKRKQAIILHYYRGDDPEKRKIASTLLESFLFYSGFFLPLWWDSKAKLTQTAAIIQLILRDESIHGYYIGYKFQQAYKNSSPERQKELYDFTIQLMKDLYANEEKYTEYLYDDISVNENQNLTSHVKTFLKYNANKALMNLGFEGYFPPEETEVLPQILASLNPSNDSNTDFFSGTPNYTISGLVDTEDDDWEF